VTNSFQTIEIVLSELKVSKIKYIEQALERVVVKKCLS